ncbi:MAG: phosphonate ABC transporter, permease protein PhnE [Phycisphaerales bacterium]|nr:MAG: phosphonate ABC transporter, permease protein PhnE [Phycisphaerales bacterium]
MTTLTAQPAATPERHAPPREPENDRPAFRIRNLTHTYPRGVRALRDLWTDIPAARHTVIVGPSGSGKTTLLACLSGRLTPTAGAVERQGAVATIYQDLRLVPERTVLGNVLDGCLGRVGAWRSTLAMPAEERREALTLLERVGLRERANMPLAALSGGERQRVALARALMQRPQILLADEPVCSLDRANAERVMELLRAVCAERGVTLVSVLHDEQLAARFADHRLTLRAGRLSEPPQPDRLVELKQHIPGETVLQACATCAGTQDAAACRCDHPPASREQPEDAAAAIHPARPAWMHPGALLAIGLLVLIAYAWSTVSLGLHQTNGRGVLNGLTAFLAALVPTSWTQLTSIPWRSIWASLIETLQMSLIGTTVGVALAYPAAVLAARNTGPRFIRGPVRQMLNAVRTVPSLIWALLFVAAVGLGPLAGVLALSLYSVGYLSKFFYESFEHAPKGPQNALKELGASGPQRFLRAVGPATRPAALASALFMLEYNVRAASVLGIVDAGGIGYYIRFYLEIRNFPAALACLVLIFGVVVALDAVSVRLRRSLIPD